MKKMLYKIVVTFVILVTFFSININVNAASFKYSDFDWDEFLEQNKNYWVSSCDEGDDKCYDRILKTQEKFYTQLYKLLAQYEKKGIVIKDSIIIETVFYGLTPSSFKDPVVGENNPYNVDDDITSFIGSDDGNLEAAEKYFKDEKNSLKTLMNNMVSYMQPCYGISSQTPTISNGIPSCSDGYIPDGNTCVKKLDDYDVSFMERIFERLDVLGVFDSENDKKCESTAIEEGFTNFKLGNITATPVVSEDLYYDFLANSDYFDKKSHLQSYFQYVLDSTGHKSMSELDEIDYNEYKDDIILCRKRIIAGIQSVLESYKTKLSNVSMTSGTKSTYWWPIGSDDVTDSDGFSMALGNPASVNILSNYGIGANNTINNGINISGVEGVTNVIAARDGTVVSVVDENGGQCVNGDISCGGEYGNFVIIQHIDNNSTLYAHLAQNSITVKPGDVVKQGQVIGKVGSTGNTTGGYLHFEVRVGGSDNTSTQDPLRFISAEKPREVGLQSDLLEWIGSMEGTGPMEGDNYVVYNDSGGVATFGHGITVKYNADLIIAHGLTPASLNVGSLVPKSIADEMYSQIVQEEMDAVKSKVSAKGLTLSENQIAALVSLKYNVGNINKFFEPYSKYGSTESLCTNWWEKYALHDKKGNYLSGLKKRRISECDAFVNGVYNKPY